MRAAFNRIGISSMDSLSAESPQVNGIVGGSLSVALIVPLMFALALFFFVRPDVHFSLKWCPVTRAADTSSWKNAPLAKLIFLLATYSFLAGSALMISGLAMPWTLFSTTTTLSSLAASGLPACDLVTLIPSLGNACLAGRLVAASMAFCSLSCVMGFLASVISFSLTVKTRNLAHHDTTPNFTVLGDFPGAFYVGLATSALSLIGVVLSWVGFKKVIEQLPLSVVSLLKLDYPPGGFSVIFGLLFHVAGCCDLAWAYYSLGTPVVFLTGKSLFSLSAMKDVKSRSVLLRESETKSPNPPSLWASNPMSTPATLVGGNPKPAVKVFSPRTEESNDSVLSPPTTRSIRVSNPAAAQSLPEGWVMMSDNTATWWCHKETGVTTWSMPNSPSPNGKHFERPPASTSRGTVLLSTHRTLPPATASFSSYFYP